HLFSLTDPATPGISTLSLHDALPISQDDARDDRERSLGAHEQVGQVVADDVLHDLPAGPDDVAVRKYRLQPEHVLLGRPVLERTDRKSTRLNSSHSQISYAVFCLKKK